MRAPSNRPPLNVPLTARWSSPGPRRSTRILRSWPLPYASPSALVEASEKQADLLSNAANATPCFLLLCHESRLRRNLLAPQYRYGVGGDRAGEADQAEQGDYDARPASNDRRASSLPLRLPLVRGVGGPHRSLDDLIRPLQERLGDGEAEGLGGLEVEDQLEFRGLLDRECGGLGPFEDLVH